MNKILKIISLLIILNTTAQAADIQLSAPSANSAVVNLPALRRAIKLQLLKKDLATLTMVAAPIAGVSLYHSYKNNPNNRLWWTIAQNDNPQAVKALLKEGASVQGTNKHNPLVLAAQKGHVESARILLEHGADVYANGSESLTEAVKTNRAQIVWLLKEHGAMDLPYEENIAYFQYLLWVTKQNQDSARHYLTKIDPKDTDKRLYFKNYIDQAESVEALIKIKTGVQLPLAQIPQLTPEQEINMAFNIKESVQEDSSTNSISSLATGLADSIISNL